MARRGVVALVGNGSSELELAVGPRPPQHRTELAQATVEVEVSHRRFLRGLTPDQKAKMLDRRRTDAPAPNYHRQGMPAGLGKARRLRHCPHSRTREANMIRLLVLLVRLKVIRWRLERRIARR